LGYTNVSELLVLPNKFMMENITLFKYAICPFGGSGLIPLKPMEDFSGIRQRQKNAEVFLLLKIFQLWYLSHFRGKYDLKAQIQSTDHRIIRIIEHPELEGTHKDHRVQLLAPHRSTFLVINITLFQIELEILGSIYRNTAVVFKFVSARK